MLWSLTDTGYAGMNQWTQSGGPEGGKISSLVARPFSQTLYAGTYYYGGMFKSTNGGGDWTRQNLGNPAITGISALAIDPSDQSIVYVGTANGSEVGLHILRDNQGSWTAVRPKQLANQSISSIAIDPQQGYTVIYAGGYMGGVSKSLDGGATWSLIFNQYDGNWGEALSGYSIAVDPTPYVADTAKILLIGTEIGLFRSTDGGRNWTQVDGVNAQVVAMDGTTVYAGGYGKLYKNTAKGVGSWTEIAIAPDAYVTAIKIDPLNPATVYVSSSKGLYKLSAASPDSATLVDTTIGAVYAINQETTQDTVVYAGATQPIASGIVKSMNGGAWTPINHGFINSYVMSLAQDPASANTIYAGLIGGGVYRSDDRGATFSQLNTDFPFATSTSVNALKAISSVSGTYLLAGTYDGVYRYVNDSLDPQNPHWSWKAQTPPSLGYIHGFTASSPDPVTGTRQIFVATEHGAFLSTDGGNIWSLVSESNHAFNDLVIAPDGTLYGAGYRYEPSGWDTLDSGIYKRQFINGAWVWTNLTSGITPYLEVGRLVISGDASAYNMYAGASYPYPNACSYVSTDKGASWNRMATCVGTPVIDPTSPTTLYAADKSRRSRDGGATWSTYGTGFGDNDHVLTPILVDPTGTTLYFGTYGVGLWSMTLGTTLTATPSSNDFGNLYVGRTASRSFTVTNSGGENLVFSSIGITGVDKGEFSLSGSCLTTAYLKRGESCQVDAMFSPTTRGTKTASLDITFNGASGSLQQIPLSGNGTMVALNLGVSGNGSIQVEGNTCPLLCNYEFPYGTAVTITANPGQDSDFAAWSGCNSMTNSCTITMDADKTASATFQLKTYHLTARAENFGGTISPTDVWVQYGGYQDFIIVPNQGYKLARLLDNNNDVTTAVVNGVYHLGPVTGPHEIVVSFIQTTLTGINAMATDTTAHGQAGNEVIYAGTKHGLYRSATGGNSWEPVTTAGLPNVNVAAIAVDTAAAPAMLYIATQAGIYAMNADGTVWNLVYADNNIKSLTVDKGGVPHTLYAGTNGGIIVIKR
jgi:hypothetical protein